MDWGIEHFTVIVPLFRARMFKVNFTRRPVFACRMAQHDTLTRLVDKGECWRLDYQVRHGAILSRRQDAENQIGASNTLP
jgi:hypothetical protein